MSTDLFLPVNASDHSLGPAHAPIVLVEYGDFECPNCKQAAPVVKHLLERFARHLRVVWRNFPLEGVHPHALNAALAAETAGAQHKFWPMHDLLFVNQEHLKLPQLRRYAQQLDLDMPRYDREMDDTVYLQRVREHIESGNRSHVRSTPTFFVNGMLQDVSFGLEALEKRIEEEARNCDPAS